MKWRVDNYRSVNALAETINGCYKTELIYGPTHPGPWKSHEEVELATLGWVHWYNNERIHTALGDVTPAGFEALLYAANSDPKPAVAIQQPESPPNPERLSHLGMLLLILPHPQPDGLRNQSAGLGDRTDRAFLSDDFKSKLFFKLIAVLRSSH